MLLLIYVFTIFPVESSGEYFSYSVIIPLLFSMKVELLISTPFVFLISIPKLLYLKIDLFKYNPVLKIYNPTSAFFKTTFSNLDPEI